MSLSCLSDKVRRARTDSALTSSRSQNGNLCFTFSLQDRRWFILRPWISTNFSLFTPWTTYTGWHALCHPSQSKLPSSAHHKLCLVSVVEFFCNSIKRCEHFGPFPLLPSCRTTQSGPKSGFWRCDSGLPHAQNKLPKEIN